MKRIACCAEFLLLFAFLWPSKFIFAEFTSPEMVLVPKGSFEIGNNDFKNAQPVHKVILSNDFYMSKYEITNQQYADMLNYAWEKGYLDKEAFAETSKKKEARGATKFPQKYQDVFDEHSQITFENGVFKAHAGKENFPVVEVTWYGAAFYCNMLSEKEGITFLYNPDNWICEFYGKTGYRLPTEAEWEYAAKYDDNRKYPWGNSEPDDTYANIKKSINAQTDVLTTAVGSYSPKGDTKLGIADMAGNVAELCNDWYDISYSDKPYETDPTGPSAGLQVYAVPMKKYLAMKVVRGASFLYDSKFREGMGVPFLIDSVTRPEAVTTSGRSFDCVNMSRQVEGFRVIKIVMKEQVPLMSETKNKTPLSIVKIHMSKGIKYIPDKTHNQLTEEDTVYNHYVYEQDSQGKTIKNKCYNIGPDNTVITSEQYLKYYLAYEYNNEKKLIKEICYNDKGPDSQWFTTDDIESYYSVYEYDHNGNNLKVVRYAKDGTVLQYTAFQANPQGVISIDTIYKGKGADSQWFTTDDEIEKYHRFYYDDKGVLIRIAEYHSERNGQGADGVWLTADDLISATKVLSYGEDGFLTQIKKCIGPGQDNLWFSDDDVVQYYTVYESV